MNFPNIKFKNYKSFGSNWVSMEDISNVNILIGRNNSGKSSVLDVIEGLTDANRFHRNSLLNTAYSVEIEHIITDQEIIKSLKPYNIPDFSPYIQRFSGTQMTYNIKTERDIDYSSTDNIKHKYEKHHDPTALSPFSLEIGNAAINPYQQFKFRKLSADRDIIPEADSTLPVLEENGNGATSIIKTFLLEDEYNEKIIENNLLCSLNAILAGDATYEKIRIQTIKNETDEDMWEIFLEEHKQRYPLSKMGSGLKTILLVLINLLVLPEMKEYKDSNIIFAFEELENNLHPALQRRLFDYLYQYSIEKNIPIFLTTHSHVAINLFSNKDKTRLFHVNKNDGISTLEPINDYIGKSQLLEDLDVKASDLLQSNGIIWVEGPSDRIYIKKWIELYTDKEFKEGRDYQFLYYGGRLLKHYSTEEEVELINILTTNRHVAIVIDSDKRSKFAKINDTKKRIKSEFQQKSLFCWITQGKEIENYLKYETLQKALNNPNINSQCGQYELFPEYIASKYKQFSDKVGFARKITSAMTADDNIIDILDLRKQIYCLIEIINSWNSG